MTEFISNLIGNDHIATMVMSFVPMIELKGAIVYARALQQPMNLLVAFLLSYLGSTLVFFPIYWLLRPILNLMKRVKWFRGLAEKVEGYFSRKADETLEKQKDKNRKRPISDTLLKQIGVFLFVAIPLPMTGVWTGTAIAVFLNLKFKDAVLPVVIGNAVAGGLIVLLTVVCEAVKINLDYVLYALFALAVVLLIITILKIALGKPKTQSTSQDEDIKD